MTNYLVKWADRGEEEFWITISEMRDTDKSTYDHAIPKMNVSAESKNELMRKLRKLDQGFLEEKKIQCEGKEYNSFAQLANALENN